MFSGIQILELGALPLLLQFDHKSSSSDDLTLQQMEKRENVNKTRLQVLYRVSLRASSPFGGYREKLTNERRRGSGSAVCSRVLARLASLASMIGELARTLVPGYTLSCS